MSKKKKTEKKENLSHGDLLRKNIEDIKFVVILLVVLILIVGAWNIYNNMAITDNEALISRYDKVREDLQLKATPPFLIKAKKIRERKKSDINMKDLVKTTCEKGAQFKAGSFWESVKGSKSSIEEHLTTPPIELVTMHNLVTILDHIKQSSLDIWCTEINKLEPLLNEDGFAQDGITESKGSRKEVIGYKVSSLRFSRFRK